MIRVNGADALHLLRGAAAEHPDRVAAPSYVRRQPGTVAGREVVLDVPCCIVGHALAHAGVPLHRLDAPGGITILAASLRPDVVITPHACRIMEAAQFAQDLQLSWWEALHAAEYAAWIDRVPIPNAVPTVRPGPVAE